MRAMKDSGAPWCDKIPVNWQTLRLKYVMDNYDSQRMPVDAGKRSQEGDILYDYYGASGVIDSIDGYTHVGRRILIGEDGANLVLRNLPLIYIADGKYWVNNHAHILAPKYGWSLDFFAHQMEIIDYFEYITGSAQPKLSQGNLSKVCLVVPPVGEQERIADFLDSKCAEIDALSADIQSEIEILEAYKRSKVFDTVMHGLSHDRFVKTDSDVWTTIPEGWKLVDIKYLFEIVKRIAGKEGYDIIAITQQGLKYKDITSNEGQLASDYSGYQFVYPGDFAMNHMDLLTGWVDLSDKFGVTSPDYRVFRLRYPDTYDRGYYKYIMQCCYMNRIFYSLGQGVSNLGRWRLQTSAFNNFKVPVPPYDEQVKIGNHLEMVISEINHIISQKQEQISVLSDYKKSIIYEYVTGKKEIPSN